LRARFFPSFSCALLTSTRPRQDVLYEQGDGPEFSRATWQEAKGELEKQTPFANLPYLIDSQLARPLTESKAILLHLARVLDLHGETEQEKCDVEVREGLCCALPARSLVLSLECDIRDRRPASLLYAPVLLTRL
jgi:hypothetical protein